MTKPEYKWGETPLGNMSHAELLEAAHRLYMAAISVRGAVGMIANISVDPYWTTSNGLGAIALEKTKQAL